MRPDGQRHARGHLSDRHYISYLFPLIAPPLTSVKGREGQLSQGLADEPNTRSKGLGSDTLSPLGFFYQPVYLYGYPVVKVYRSSINGIPLFIARI
jgi:hypothetical protein